MDAPWWHIVSSFLGGFLGSGSLWAFLSYRQKKREIDLSSAVSVAQLHQDLSNKLIELIKVSEEYAEVRDGRIKVRIPGNKLIQLESQLTLLKESIVSCEKHLAQLERRNARDINLKYVRPAPPKNLSYKPPDA